MILGEEDIEEVIIRKPTGTRCYQRVAISSVRFRRLVVGAVLLLGGLALHFLVNSDRDR